MSGMNLIEALEYVNRPSPKSADCVRIFLACGSTPLHVETFLNANLRKLCPTSRIEVKTGLFGDLVGNLERLQPHDHDALVILIEWSDLDSRLGVRNLGGWQLEKLPDTIKSATLRLRQLSAAVDAGARVLPTYVCLPTLPLPPLFYTGTQIASTFEFNLRASVALFAEEISQHRHVRVVSTQHLDEQSPLSKRFDPRTEITQGFPYSTFHTSVLGQVIAELICRPEPKKGLITDLDDTMWSGILGEVGVEGITWNSDRNAQIHGIYQQFLASLASSGVLIGVASKNEPALVEAALRRNDLLISKDSMFPIEASWGRKSESVKGILRRWNVLADSVIFIDDSAMEVAEVQAAFPEMECLVFPKNDYGAMWKLLTHLRDRFAKTQILEEDSVRVQSIRSSEAFRDSSLDQCSMDDFLEQAEGHLTFVAGKLVEDKRAFELVNKTNQFNLNGKRYDERAWSTFFNEPRARAITVSYEDKFGKLGKIAVMMGKVEDGRFVMDSWVMSCRAFSRRIEYHCLQYLFEAFDIAEIAFQVHTTGRNGPILELLKGFAEGPIEGPFRLTRPCFWKKALKMPHKVLEEALAEWKID